MTSIANQSLYPINYLLNDNYTNLKKDGSVAIIMRTKNRPVLLARAIESVVQQTYPLWHLYLINDGGDIESVNKLVDYNLAYLQDKITVIHNTASLGMEAASNCGFDIATEEYVVIHDDDDSWHPNFLKETVNYLNLNLHAVAVLTNCIIVHEEIIADTVKQLCTFDWPFWQNTIDINSLIKSNISPPICLLIRMNVAKQIGKFNESLPVLGDWDYNLRLFRVGEIQTLNKKLAYYHHRPSSKNFYGNSIAAGIDIHKKYQIKFRNSLVRKLLIEDQGNFGLLHILLDDNEKKYSELVNKINRLEFLINNSQENLLYLRKRAFPLKRFAAKIRQKIKKWRKK